MADGENEGDAIQKVANSMNAGSFRHGASVLLLDDTIRSGGTMLEMARVCREGGAERIFGLGVAKDAKFTFSGVDLTKERWR